MPHASYFPSLNATYQFPMSLIQDFSPLLPLDHAITKTRLFSDSFLQSLHEFTTNPSCEGSESELCRDESTAFILKFVAMASILVAGIGGIAIPLVGKHKRILRSDGEVLPAAKAFAAGVILATGFVHMLQDAWEALNHPCLKSNSHVWSKFPFTGFFAMLSALLTLLVDFLGTQYYERRQQGRNRNKKVVVGDDGVEELLLGSEIVEVKEVYGEESGGVNGMHIVGIHAHAAHHSHSHSYDGVVQEELDGHGHSHSHSHSHSHAFGGGGDDVETTTRHVVVSQVLELGIVSHSMIIGLSLGVSQSPCTMRPLIAALSFHQFFEGFALGGCISEAQFNPISATIMACFFALTTPLGVAIGIGIASNFNPNSPGALITEGILDSLSAGILVYMALVDLIAADFQSKRMRCNFRLQIVSYCLLFLGALLMSSLALWA